MADKHINYFTQTNKQRRKYSHKNKNNNNNVVKTVTNIKQCRKKTVKDTKQCSKKNSKKTSNNVVKRTVINLRVVTDA